MYLETETVNHQVLTMSKKNKKKSFTFIDLFAGIGGFHTALHNLGGECVFASEWDKFARITYEHNFKKISPKLFETSNFNGDINEIAPEEIPDFEVLCAGFPCQPFSIAGKQEGFNDTRGTLFFNIEKIIEAKRPKVVFLENVKNLVSHDKGNTFKTIIETLENKLNYRVYYKVLNSATHSNVPQNRERIFIVGFDETQIDKKVDFEFPSPIPLTRTIHDVLEKNLQDELLYFKEDHKYYPELRKTMNSRDTLYQWRRVYVRENKNNLCPTLTANMGMGGHNVPLVIDDFGIRKLTPKECLAFQGFPSSFSIPSSMAKSHSYKQAGNSVVVPLIERVAGQILKVIL